MDGTEISLDTTSGKAYVVSFWASWCGPCRRELPILSNIQRIAGARIQVIAVNIEDREVFRKLQHSVVALGLTPAFDPGRKAQHAYGVNGIPHMIIIGRDGRISAVHRGYGEDALPDIATDLNNALAAEPDVPSNK
jgi:thiol-disulfide isomerase/thioredoxin